MTLNLKEKTEIDEIDLELKQLEIRAAPLRKKERELKDRKDSILGRPTLYCPSCKLLFKTEGREPFPACIKCGCLSAVEKNPGRIHCLKPWDCDPYGYHDRDETCSACIEKCLANYAKLIGESEIHESAQDWSAPRQDQSGENKVVPPLPEQVVPRETETGGQQQSDTHRHSVHEPVRKLPWDD